jgi:hypothetical protein
VRIRVSPNAGPLPESPVQDNPVKRTQRILVTAFRCMVWGAPWICMFAVSGSLAYALNVALGGGPSAQDEGSVSVSVASAEVLAAAARLYYEDDGTPCQTTPCSKVRRWLPVTGGSCESISIGQQYVGLNTLILAEAITSCTH